MRNDTGAPFSSRPTTRAPSIPCLGSSARTTRPSTTTGAKHPVVAASPSTISQTCPSLQPVCASKSHAGFFLSALSSLLPHPVAETNKPQPIAVRRCFIALLVGRGGGGYDPRVISSLAGPAARLAREATFGDEG